VADRTVFVDGTTSGTPGTNGAHYASLQAMVTGEVGAAPDLVGDSAILNVECSVFGGNAADTTACVVSGFTTDATHYVNIYTPVAGRPLGTWDDTKYRLAVANPGGNGVLDIRQEFTRLVGIQVRKTASNASDQMVLTVGSIGNTSAVYLSECIVRNVPGDAFRGAGIWVVDADVTVYVLNCIIYGFPDVVSNYASAVMVETGAAYVYSTTAIGGFLGLFVGTGATCNAKNSYFAETSTDGSAASITNGGTFNQTTCAVSDGSTLVDAGLRNIAHNTTTFTNVTPGSENYHLPSGSPLIDVGTNTSGEADPLNFTTDIDLQTRTGTWDIGADERVTAATVTMDMWLGRQSYAPRPKTAVVASGFTPPNKVN
jgi:hypothetical protein